MQSQLTLGQVSWGVGCLVKDHNHLQQNKIMEICMKQGCTLPNILCTYCKKLHYDHREKLVSIAEIEDQFKSAQQDNHGKNFLLILKEFVQFATIQLEGIIKSMKLLFNSSNVLESIIIKNKQQSYYQLKDQVSELVKLIEFDNFKVKFKQPNQQEINIQFNNLANQYLLEITNFMKLNGILDQPIQQQSTQRNKTLIIQQQYKQQQNNVVTGVKSKIKNFHFLQQECGKKIKCISRYCVRDIDNKDEFFNKDHIAYLNRNLNLSEGASVVFQINSLERYIENNYIGIGICQFEKAIFKNNDYDKIGSGFYFIKSNGQVYNNDYEEYNDKTNCYFKILQDIKYRLTFDPENKENQQFALEQIDNSLKQLLKQEKKITMPMKIDYSYNYRIFVYLLGQGTEIEIINE